MKHYLTLFVCLFAFGLSTHAQTEKDKLALEVSKVDTENTEKLKAYIWKFHALVMGEGDNRTTLVSEFSYDESGALNVQVVDGETTIKKKPGIRGKIQENAIEDKMDYVAKALRYALTYTYMTKGQLLDFFDKAELTESRGVLVATAKNIMVDGDELTIEIDMETKRYLKKSFSSKLGEDQISGEVEYEVFKTSGVNHISTTTLHLPAEGIHIEGENKDYTIRID